MSPPIRSRTTALALAVAVGLALAGCAANEPASAPPASTTGPAAPSASSLVARSPSPSLDPHPPVADLVLHTSGLGPLTIGLPPETNPGAQMIVFKPDQCAGHVSDPARGPGRWVANYPPFVDAEGNEKPQFWVDANAAHGVYWIEVINPAIATAAGIRVGSTLAALPTAYPDVVGGTPGPASQPWWVSDTKGTLVFEVQDDSLGLQSPGTPPTVVIIHVQAPGVDPDWTSANTDLVAGGC